MTINITKDGALQIDLQELCDSMPEDVRRTFARQTIFQEAIFEGIVDTVANGGAYEGYWYIGNMAERLRVALMPLMPEAVQELVAELLSQRDHAKRQEQALRDHIYKLARKWPESANPNPAWDMPTSQIRTSWKRADVEAYLTRELGEGWQEGITQEQSK